MSDYELVKKMLTTAGITFEYIENNFGGNDIEISKRHSSIYFDFGSECQLMDVWGFDK